MGEASGLSGPLASSVACAPVGALEDALALSRDGDVAGAADVLRQAQRAGPLPDAALSLLFQLVTKTAPTDEGLAVATTALEAATTPRARSQWAVRRGLLRVERGDRAGALADLQWVMKLKANEGHVEQARAALLRVAALPKGRDRTERPRDK